MRRPRVNFGVQCRNRSRSKGLILGLLMFLSIGCAATLPETKMDPAPESSVKLRAWVEKDLLPYLVEQLGKHPKFKGQPFIVVSMRGDNVQTEIDYLTKAIREEAFDALMAEPGINLMWRPSLEPWRHHTSLKKTQCRDFRKLAFYVGIDINFRPIDRGLRVKVRALNIQENKWESGFGLVWQGKPTKTQLAALGRKETDEYLRGLRPLPFTDEEPDLLASYLARNLSCLFRYGEKSDVVVHMERSGAASGEFFSTTLNLVDNYLDKFREVRVTKDPEKANTILHAEVHRIHGTLHQIWVSAVSKPGMISIPGAETEAYVRVKKSRLASSNPPNRIDPPPIYNTMPIISSFRVVTPVSLTLCKTDTPWIAGARDIRSDDQIPSGTCLGIEVISNRPGYVFLIGQDGEGRFLRLFPSDCDEFSGINRRLRKGRPFRFPLQSNSRIRKLVLKGELGTERIYVVAIADPRLARKFEKRIELLGDLCSPGRNIFRVDSSYNPTEKWERYLNRMVRENRGALDWRVLRFEHVSRHYSFNGANLVNLIQICRASTISLQGRKDKKVVQQALQASGRRDAFSKIGNRIQASFNDISPPAMIRRYAKGISPNQVRPLQEIPESPLNQASFQGIYDLC